MEELKQALKSTLNQLTAQMTAQVRRHALSDGWEQDVANSLSVVHTNNSLSIQVDDQFADKAFTHEFGTENSSPKATLRKFGNQNESAEVAALAIFNKFVSKKL
jgi:hypothetical protein